MRKLFSAIALTLCAVLSVSACTGKDSDPNTSDNNEQPAPGAPNPDATPGIQTIDGYKTDARLGDGLAHIDLELPWSDGGPELMTKGRFQVLSLDRKGDNVRMVAAWLEPESGPFMGSRALASGMDALNYSPTTKLWDPQTNEIISPLQLNDESNRDKCHCSGIHSRSSDVPTTKERVELFWVDFPAPANKEVRVIPSEWSGPIDQPITITDNQPFTNPAPDIATFADNEDPADEYGSPEAKRYIDKLQDKTESLLGSSTTTVDVTTALNITADVLFDFDKSEINDKGHTVLSNVAKTLNQQAAGQTVKVVGHTDAKGDENYNKKLSEDRAKAVEKELQPQLTNVQLETEGRGETQPIAKNFDSQGHDLKANQAKNRRVSFEFKPTDTKDLQVDTGQRTNDVPKVKSITPPDGALASAEFLLPESHDNPIRIDINKVAEKDGYVRLDYGFSVAGNTPNFSYFSGVPGNTEFQFGLNDFTGGLAPSSGYVSLIDSNNIMHFSPQVAGRGCLCTEATGTDRAGYSTPAPMYGYFPKKLLDEGKVTLRIGDSGKWDIDLKDLEARSK